MDGEKREKLLRCIRADDSKAFGALADGEIFSTLYGRFPLLSLLYLFRARRIVKKFFAELIKDRPRRRETGFREAEALFVKKAGKSLRHFSDREVSPLEMLAVLGAGKRLKKLYPIYPAANRYLPSIHAIYYTRTGKGVTVVGDRLILPKEPLSYREKRFCTAFAYICLGVGVVIAAVTSVLSVWFGLGNSKVYYKARSGGALLSALKAEQSLYLKKDVTLAGGATQYDNVVEGNGYTIRLQEPFVESFSGELRNVTFVLEEGFRGAGVILENTGKLENVRVIAKDLSLSKSEENIGLLTAVNKGTITDCTAEIAITIEGDSMTDCYFAAFAGTNEGEISRCRAEGSITARNVDIAGIAGENGTTGKVADCSVDLRLTERTDLRGWAPNVAGIVDHNQGEISGCVAEGRVESIYSFSEEGEVSSAAYAAGIVCVNVGSILNCTNRSEVVATAAQGVAMAGGIVTRNGYKTNKVLYTGTISHCLGKSEVRATSSTHSAYAGGIAAENLQGSLIDACGQSASLVAQGPNTVYDIVGGIVGVNEGAVANSFFSGTLEDYDADSLIGGICGITTLRFDFFGHGYVEMENNAFTAENVLVNGGMISEAVYSYLNANAIYGAAFIEDETALSDYVASWVKTYKEFNIELDADKVRESVTSSVREVLDFGAEKVTTSELKQREIYYE